MMIEPPTGADAIRAELEARGWSVDDLADRASIRRDIVDKIVTGQRMIGVAIAVKLARALGRSPADWINQRRRNTKRLHPRY